MRYVRSGHVHRVFGTGNISCRGMAIAGKLDKKDYYVYVILGDGEMQEGQVWEALMSASTTSLTIL